MALRLRQLKFASRSLFVATKIQLNWSCRNSNYNSAVGYVLNHHSASADNAITADLYALANYRASANVAARSNSDVTE